MEPPVSPVLGREDEIRKVKATLMNPEVSNALLLAEPGVGKSALVSAMTLEEPEPGEKERVFMEMDIGLMSASEHGEDGALQMTARLKRFFNEVNLLIKRYTRKEIVFFIDEFHMIIELSSTATEAIKPVLARSGRGGVRIIGATTYNEYHQYIEPNAALADRWVRINMYEPPKEIIIEILKEFARSHNVESLVYDDTIYGAIVDYTDRYMLARAQPRKSVQTLDQMIGWHLSENLPLDRHLLAKVIQTTTGIKVNVEFDGLAVKNYLNQHVLNQKPAVYAIEKRLQIATADLHDETRPMASFLFTGSTGVGKTEMAKQLAAILFEDDRALIRFDMSEYSEPSAVSAFRTQLTSEVWNRSHAILLFDEIEKASTEVTRLLLQVLDDGRLSNREGRQVSFLNTYIIMTTNAASTVYSDTSVYLDDEKVDSDVSVYEELMPLILRELQDGDTFPPEVLGRVDEIVPFIPLLNAGKEGVLRIKLRELADKVRRKHGADLVFSSRVIGYIVYDEQSDDVNAGGARDIARQLSSDITSSVARYINYHPSVKRIGVGIKGTMQHEDETKRKSEAKVVVGELSQPKEASVQDYQAVWLINKKGDNGKGWFTSSIK